MNKQEKINEIVDLAMYDLWEKTHWKYEPDDLSQYLINEDIETGIFHGKLNLSSREEKAFWEKVNREAYPAEYGFTISDYEHFVKDRKVTMCKMLNGRKLARSIKPKKKKGGEEDGN